MTSYFVANYVDQNLRKVTGGVSSDPKVLV